LLFAFDLVHQETFVILPKRQPGHFGSLTLANLLGISPYLAKAFSMEKEICRRQWCH